MDTGTLIPSGTYTDTQTAVPAHDHHEGDGQPFRGVLLTVTVTDIHSDTPEIAVHVEGHNADDAGADYRWKTKIAQSDDLTSVATTQLLIHPSATALAATFTDNVFDDTLPYRWRVKVVHTDDKPIDYSITYEGIR